MRKFWGIDSSGMESLPVLSVNEKMVIEKAESSIKFVDSHYQITIPWKEDRPSLPDSFKVKVYFKMRGKNKLQNLLLTKQGINNSPTVLWK